MSRASDRALDRTSPAAPEERIRRRNIAMRESDRGSSDETQPKKNPMERKKSANSGNIRLRKLHLLMIVVVGAILTFNNVERKLMMKGMKGRSNH